MKNWPRYISTILLKFRLFSNIVFLGRISEIWITNIIPEYQDILYAEYVKNHTKIPKLKINKLFANLIGNELEMTRVDF